MGQETGDQEPKLTLPPAIQAEMVKYCLASHPKAEACGFLIADASGRIERVQPMRNAEPSPIGYSMDPKEQLQVEKQLRQRDERVVAIYHSHTATAAEPSLVDIEHAISSDISYIIVSTANTALPVVKSYRIYGKEVIPEPIFPT